MRKDYLQRVKGFSNAFIQDVLDTLKRINLKDGKAYPLRIQKSVATRWKSCPRYKVTLTLNYLEYMGVLICTLETAEEYKERMSEWGGLNRKGLRRKYFKVNPSDKFHANFNKSVNYTKLSYKELGVPHSTLEEYPV